MYMLLGGRFYFYLCASSQPYSSFFFFNDTATTEIYTLSLHDALPISPRQIVVQALTESVLLAIGGGIVGLVVAMAAARLLLVLAFHSSHFLPISTAPSLKIGRAHV